MDELPPSLRDGGGLLTDERNGASPPQHFVLRPPSSPQPTTAISTPTATSHPPSAAPSRAPPRLTLSPTRRWQPPVTPPSDAPLPPPPQNGPTPGDPHPSPPPLLAPSTHAPQQQQSPSPVPPPPVAPPEAAPNNAPITTAAPTRRDVTRPPTNGGSSTTVNPWPTRGPSAGGQATFQPSMSIVREAMLLPNASVVSACRCTSPLYQCTNEPLELNTAFFVCVSLDNTTDYGIIGIEDLYLEKLPQQVQPQQAATSSKSFYDRIASDKLLIQSLIQEPSKDGTTNPGFNSTGQYRECADRLCVMSVPGINGAAIDSLMGGDTSSSPFVTVILRGVTALERVIVELDSRRKLDGLETVRLSAHVQSRENGAVVVILVRMEFATMMIVDNRRPAAEEGTPTGAPALPPVPPPTAPTTSGATRGLDWCYSLFGAFLVAALTPSCFGWPMVC